MILAWGIRLANTGPAMLAIASMAVACAVLSIFVVSRRWAFIGEGISHSGFGGAGSAWLLALVFPSLEQKLWVPFLGVIVFCLATAWLIGYLTRRQRINSDAAVGIFLVASLAWGFLARQIYVERTGRPPAGFETLLFGYVQDVSATFAIGALLLGVAVVAAVTLLFKEIVYYCFDPVMAEASGVPAGWIHYLLMLLVALTIIIGARLVGTVLVTALLVLPGATALLVTPRLRSAIGVAVGTALAGAMLGLLAQSAWPALPTGPIIVLSLFIFFAAAFFQTRFRVGNQ